MSAIVLDERAATRFRSKVRVAEADGCWEWSKGGNEFGYGHFYLSGRTTYAHRVAWALAHSDPGGLAVLHRCDNPRCVNPGHLFLGTLLDNNADKQAKGRQARGSDQGSAKLTANQVLAIRDRLDGGDSCALIARDLGVSRALISHIHNGRLWSWLTGRTQVNRKRARPC